MSDQDKTDERLSGQRRELQQQWADPQAQWFAAVLLDIADSLHQLAYPNAAPLGEGSF